MSTKYAVRCCNDGKLVNLVFKNRQIAVDKVIEFEAGGYWCRLATIKNNKIDRVEYRSPWNNTSIYDGHK